MGRRKVLGGLRPLRRLGGCYSNTSLILLNGIISCRIKLYHIKLNYIKPLYSSLSCVLSHPIPSYPILSHVRSRMIHQSQALNRTEFDGRYSNLCIDYRFRFRIGRLYSMVWVGWKGDFRKGGMGFAFA